MEKFDCIHGHRSCCSFGGWFGVAIGLYDDRDFVCWLKDQKEFLYSCLTDAAERHLSGRPCLWEELRDLEPTMDDDDAIQDDELSCGSGDGSDSDSD